MKLSIGIAGGLLACSLVAAIAGFSSRESTDDAKRGYAYRSPAFDGFVRDSYREIGSDNYQAFYQWFEGSFERVADESLEAFVAQAKTDLAAASDTSAKIDAEAKFAQELHRRIKMAIPKFSLDGGFEFTNTASLGERQCFLQSVLIAGILQKAGIDAGVAMVFENEKGEPSNNGHAVTVMTLDNDSDLLVDASEPHAFAVHAGLFMRLGEGRYRYFEPSYAKGSLPSFDRGRLVGSGKIIDAGQIDTLDIPFLRSQFDYYRGERAPYGLLAKAPTSDGLARSLTYLKRARQECKDNPLVVCGLGYVQEKLGDKRGAAKTFRDAAALYAADGWTPAGLTAALKRSQGY